MTAGRPASEVLARSGAEGGFLPHLKRNGAGQTRLRNCFVTSVGSFKRF